MNDLFGMEPHPIATDFRDFAGHVPVSSFSLFNMIRNNLIQNPDELIATEQRAFSLVTEAIRANKAQIKRDFDAASQPEAVQTWWNYSPLGRGRSPVGDNVPWSEVSERSIAPNVIYWLAKQHELAFPGWPTGPDKHFAIPTFGLHVSIDAKSCGPRDDPTCVVLSTNQVTGSGTIADVNDALINETILACGQRREHNFSPALSPLLAYCGSYLIHVTITLTAIYRQRTGQQLTQIVAACVPNGVLNLPAKHPGLFYPGKDDKATPDNKKRARLSLPRLAAIAPWRVSTIILDF